MSAHDCATGYDVDCRDCVSHDQTCGVRCDRCNERMCEWFGPEPRSCSTTCTDCECDCTACWDARIDLRDELLRQIEREKDIA